MADARSTTSKTTEPTASGPNPLCDVGRTHPRDRHRMRPVEGYDQVWFCPRHDLYAVVVPAETARGLDRGEAHALPGGDPGVVVRQGDERGGGTIVYLRAR